MRWWKWERKKRRKLQSCISRRQSKNRDRPSLWSRTSFSRFFSRNTFYECDASLYAVNDIRSFLLFDFNFRNSVAAKKKRIFAKFVKVAYSGASKIYFEKCWMWTFIISLVEAILELLCLKGPYIDIFVTTWIFRC